LVSNDAREVEGVEDVEDALELKGHPDMMVSF
jgi:hypothetical protein